MPSAANMKIDKQIPSENALGENQGNSTNSLRQAITVIEHKIRNLEKRKAKLESYRDLQSAGKELNADQRTAVAKYGEVVFGLDFARELRGQFVGIAVGYEKEAKKTARREAQVKQQAELARLREILLVQDALNQMGSESVREDFLRGRNGAAQLSETDLKLLDDLYPAVTPKHEAGNPAAFVNEVQSAAEHLLAVVDGKPKEVFGGTYSQVKEILGKIHESGYFDQATAEAEEVFETYTETVVLEPEQPLLAEPVLNAESALPSDGQQELPPLQALSIDARPPPLQPPIEPAPAVEPPLAPEQPIYYQQPPRPITEMLGTGSFFFLQESELDTPPEQIPSQTFTNQNYVGVPPPPIPLPTHYQPPGLPQGPPQQSPSNGGMQTENVPAPLEDPPHAKQPRGPRAPPNATYYQQNNGYNNRPRQRNGGPRSNGGRH